MNKNRNKDILTYGIMLLSGLCFYLIPGKWLSIEDDTIAYLSPGGREGVMPGYPAFLAFLKGILGEQYFLHGAVIVQSLLAVVCTFLFVLMLKKQFKLNGIESILLYLLSMLPFSIYLPEVGITHQIMTEGITYAIFYLFFIAVIKAVWTLDYRWFLGSEAAAVFLGLTRSQLLLLQATCLGVFIWMSIRKFGKKSLKVGAGLLILLAAVVAVGGSKIQNFTSQFDTVLMARGFYEADEEDVELFDDEIMKDIFIRTYQLADEAGHRYEYAEQGLYMWQDLVYDGMNKYVVQAIEEYNTEHQENKIQEGRPIWRKLGWKVLWKHFDRYLYHTIRLMMPSFIATVFFQIRPIYLLCHLVTLGLYLISILGCIIIYRKNGDKKAVELLSMILCIMIIMVIMVNLLFIGLQRYMVYGMGIFYCSIYLAGREIYLMWKKKIEKGLIGYGNREM